MKTIEDLTTDIIQIAQWNGVFNGELRIHTEELLKQFESDIREDQIEITAEIWRKYTKANREKL